MATWSRDSFCLARFPVANGANTVVSLQEKMMMNGVKILAILLIVAGGLGLLYGGFTYTKDTHQAKLGPIELSVKETETVNVPIWAGLGAVVAGVVLLFVRK